MSTFPLELVTPERILFSAEVQSVRAPGVDGSFGVLARHAPMLTELTTGLIKLVLPSNEEAYIATTGGFLQVRKDKVLILADSADMSEEIDVEKAKASAAKARKLLEVPGSDIDAEEVRKELAHAENLVKVAGMK